MHGDSAAAHVAFICFMWNSIKQCVTPYHHSHCRSVNQPTKVIAESVLISLLVPTYCVVHHTQTDEIEALKIELDGLRQRTFPSFAHAHSSAGASGVRMTNSTLEGVY